MSEQNHNSVSDDEISLKDLILKFWEYFYHVLKSWKIIALFVILGLAFKLFDYITHIPTYTATISFMINEDEGSSLGGLGGLLGSFGGLLGGSSEYNLDKVLEISKSDRIGENIILKQSNVNGKVDFIGNHLIISQDTLKRWVPVSWYQKPFIDYERRLLLRAHRFTVDTINYDNPVETYALKQLNTLLFGQKNGKSKGIVESEYGELTGIMKISTSSLNSILSIDITNSIFEELSEFYIKKSIEKQQQTFDLMKLKHDSINDLLAANEYSLAKFQDTNRGLFKISDQVKKDQYQRGIFILATALGEAKKNLEIADFALKNKTPFIQVLDRPYEPLSSSKGSIFKTSILGLILGGMVGLLLVLVKKVYQEIMS